jgi:predicted SnoaL-like aldol condensation-catalyzing enzyme
MFHNALCRLASTVMALAGVIVIPAAVASAPPDLNGVWSAADPQQALHTTDGKLPPLLPAAQLVYEQHIAARKAGDESFDITSSCKPPGLPRALSMGRFEILQEPSQIFFLFEWNREVRMIDIGISHHEQNIYAPTYFGFSVAAWSGATLTVDTVGFNDTTILDAVGLPHSEELHLIEHYRLEDAGRTLRALISIDDPKTYARPWEIVMTFRKQPQEAQIQEDVCLERKAADLHNAPADGAQGEYAWFKVWVPSGKPDTAREEANKKLVMDWLHGFWAQQQFDQWPKWMAPDFRNHDPREPAVGAQALADWLRGQIAKHPERAPKKGQAEPAHLFFMADGDLVAVLGSPSADQSYDPSQPIKGIAGNVIRVKDGKIVEWWYIGGGGPEPAGDGPRPEEPGGTPTPNTPGR